VAVRDDHIMIVGPLPNSPAIRAGIKPGDIILAVDGESLEGFDLLAAVDLIRGPKDSTVVLTILRAGALQPMDLSVVRDTIELTSILARIQEDGVGYIRLSTFDEVAVAGLIAGLAHLAFNLDSGMPTLGASGAVAGVLGAYTVIYPAARIAILTPILFFPVIFHLPLMIYTGLWFAFQVALGIADFSLTKDVGGIAWWAHIGGFVAGLALIGVIGGQRRRVREIGDPRPRVREIGAPRARTIAIDNQMRGGPQPKPRAAGAPPRKAGRDSLARRLAKRGRSVIPQSGA